ncbi:hypothetical protein Taro_050469, partial [Colocasia esculenta]|nr:hypothetical protein [Colocasia esculenta]
APSCVSPQVFPDPFGLNAISHAIIASWQVVCNITRPKAKASRCCASFSAFYNDSIVPCGTCAYGCPGGLSCDADAAPLLLPPEALLVPFDNRTAKAKAWAKIKRRQVPHTLPCGDFCGVSINWHFAAIQINKAYRGYENVYSFNGTKLPELNNTIFFEGLPGLNYLMPISPQVFPDPSGLNAISHAIASWQVVYNITRPKAKASRCCASFSAFYNDSIVPCGTCAYGCPGDLSCDADAAPLLLPPEALLVPFDNRTAKAKAWAKIKRRQVPHTLPCGDFCGVSINWHFAAIQINKAYRGYENVYSFNGTKLPELNNTIFFEGLPGLNYLMPISSENDPSSQARVPGKKQSVISFTKKQTPGINIQKGDDFPIRVSRGSMSKNVEMAGFEGRRSNELETSNKSEGSRGLKLYDPTSSTSYGLWSPTMDTMAPPLEPLFRSSHGPSMESKGETSSCDGEQRKASCCDGEQRKASCDVEQRKENSDSEQRKSAHVFHVQEDASS